jgi:hypothetical protein
MVLADRLQANGLWRAALGAAIAGLGTCALMLSDYWSFRANGPYSGGSAGVLIGLGLWIAVGASAGLTSGRFRDAAVSWVAAVMGLLLAHWVFYTVLFPGSPYPGWDGFEGDVVMQVAFLLPFIAGGHLLGTTLGKRAQRRPTTRQT